MNLTDKDKFERWVLAPIEKLKELPRGDGAFAVLSICCGLYERFIDTKLKDAGTKASPENFRKEAATDLGCTEDAIQRFWDGYRLGMQHAFHPKSYTQDKGKGDSWGWEIASAKGFYHFPEIIKTSNTSYLVRIDPWKFADHVIDRWESNLTLINGLSEFVLGDIKPVTHAQN